MCELCFSAFLLLERGLATLRNRPVQYVQLRAPPRFSAGSLHAVAFQAWSLHVLEGRGLSRLMICPLAAQPWLHNHTCMHAHGRISARGRACHGAVIWLYIGLIGLYIYIVYCMEIYRVPYACECMWVWVCAGVGVGV